MANKAVSELDEELLAEEVDPDLDMLEVDDVSAGITKRISTKSVVIGGGGVIGPASAVDNALARFDDVTGKLIQSSDATLDDAGLLTTAAITTTGDATIGGSAVVGGASVGVTVAGSGISPASYEFAGTFAIVPPTAPAGVTGRSVGLLGGRGGTGDTDGGDNTIDAGAKEGSGTEGEVLIGRTNASAVRVGRSGATVEIEGTVGVTGDTTVTGNATITGTVTSAPHAIRSEGGAFAVTAADHDRTIRATGTTPGVAATFDEAVAGAMGTIIQDGVGGSLVPTSGTATVLIEEGFTAASQVPTAGKAVTLSYVYLTATLVHVTGGLVAE